MVNVALPPDLRSSVTIPPVFVYVPSIFEPHTTLAKVTNNNTPPSTDLRAVFMFLPFLFTSTQLRALLVQREMAGYSVTGMLSTLRCSVALIAPNKVACLFLLFALDAIRAGY